ncbi:MAG: hypothetical protein ACP5KB_01080 [Thermoprotei archaeon]|mgnify:CR=1 FL=1
MPCPWYKDGVCTSPKLEQPSSDPVTMACAGGPRQYRECRYFMERAESPQLAGVTATVKFGKALMMIHALNERPKSECEFFESEDHEGYYLAGCAVLRRYLTKFEVPDCEKYWVNCPYRKVEKSLSRD